MVRKIEGARPGRPANETPKKARGGKGRQLSANISQKLWEMLASEAHETGRSISQIAEERLRESVEGRAAYLDRMGGSEELATAVGKLADIAIALRGQLSDPSLVHVAIAEAWAAAAMGVLPVPPMSHNSLADALQLYGISSACERIVAALQEAPDTDPVRQRALQPLESVGLVPFEAFPQLVSALQPPSSQNPSPVLTRALEQLRAAGPTAGADIDLALSEIRRLSVRAARFAQEFAAARGLGRAVARAAISLNLPQMAPDQ